jgi:hypothetical protein
MHYSRFLDPVSGSAFEQKERGAVLQTRRFLASQLFQDANMSETHVENPKLAIGNEQSRRLLHWVF